MKMPSGTVFSYYEPCIFTQLMIKADDGGWGNDFLIDNLIGAVENESSGDFSEKCGRMERGESLPVDFDFTGREGLFDDDQLFAIYEEEDKKKLIKRLMND